MLKHGLLWGKDFWMGCSSKAYKAKLVMNVSVKS